MILQGLRIGPGYGGSGIGAGELSGVVGKESWIDNKMSFVPIPAPEKVRKKLVNIEKSIKLFRLLLKTFCIQNPNFKSLVSEFLEGLLTMQNITLL